jgi:hypothetical protein
LQLGVEENVRFVNAPVPVKPHGVLAVVGEQFGVVVDGVKVEQFFAGGLFNLNQLGGNDLFASTHQKLMACKVRPHRAGLVQDKPCPALPTKPVVSDDVLRAPSTHQAVYRRHLVKPFDFRVSHGGI